MRFVLFALVALLSVSTVWCISPEYKSCATPTFDATITNITANMWPPEKGKDLILNITGTNSKNITSGEYTIAIKVDGLPLPDIDGNIDTFKPLPWPIGNLTFSYTQEIPETAPSGNYVLHISAVDQDKHGIFCITLSVHIGKAEEIEGARGLFSSFLHGRGRDLKKTVRRGLEVGKTKAMKAMPNMPNIRRRV